MDGAKTPGRRPLFETRADFYGQPICMLARGLAKRGKSMESWRMMEYIGSFEVLIECV